MIKKKKYLVTGAAGFIGSHLVDRLLEDNFHKQPISLYDLKDFHMEFRIFSLDRLFEHKVKPRMITDELYDFINKTNTFMTNILDRLNKFFDPKIKGIPDGKKLRLYYEFFLMDKTYKPGNKVVLKKMNQLFGIKTKTKTKKKFPKSLRKKRFNSLRSLLSRSYS